MAYSKSTRRTHRRSYAKRPQNVSYHKVITRGSTTLDGDNYAQFTNLLSGAESSDYYGKDLGTRSNAVVGLRGSFWYWTDASEGVQSQWWLGVGTIAENLSRTATAGSEGEQASIGPLDLEGRYRPWHYRRTVPILNRYSSTTGTDLVDIPFDQAQMQLMTRNGIGARRAEKFMSVGDSYMLYAQVDADIDFSVVVAWSLQFYIREP